MSVKFRCINCNGFKSFEPHAHKLLANCDILCSGNREAYNANETGMCVAEYNGGDCYGCQLG